MLVKGEIHNDRPNLVIVLKWVSEAWRLSAFVAQFLMFSFCHQVTNTLKNHKVRNFSKVKGSL